MVRASVGLERLLSTQQVFLSGQSAFLFAHLLYTDFNSLELKSASLFFVGMKAGRAGVGKWGANRSTAQILLINQLAPVVILVSANLVYTYYFKAYIFILMALINGLSAGITLSLEPAANRFRTRRVFGFELLSVSATLGLFLPLLICEVLEVAFKPEGWFFSILSLAHSLVCGTLTIYQLRSPGIEDVYAGEIDAVDAEEVRAPELTDSECGGVIIKGFAISLSLFLCSLIYPIVRLVHWKNS